MIVVTAVTLGIIFAGLLDLLVFAPAIAYRWSVKSTSLVWLPLIWIVTSADARRGVYDRLVMLVESPWSRAMRAWSVVVTLLFLAKLALLFQLWRMAGLAGTGPLGEVVQRIVAPVELPLWQVMSFVNAVLAWAFWFRARDHLIAHERRSAYAWPEAWIRTEYAIFTVVRNTITLYVIACTLYIVATTALRANWPPLCLVLFPWSEATCFTFSRPPP